MKNQLYIGQQHASNNLRSKSPFCHAHPSQKWKNCSKMGVAFLFS
ncbi:MAG: hypothetical protein ABIN89_03615 [Chitinophagaceae bacterium]